MMGALCSAGASYSRLITVVDIQHCKACHACEEACPVHIPIVDYVKGNKGLVVSSECLLCGKCAEVCKFDAVKQRFVWNRKRYKESLNTSDYGR